MDYLTNYYKNLCEQLQEKLNILEGQREYYLKHLDGRRDRSNESNPFDSFFKKSKLKPKLNDTTDTETDDDILAMRQTAADQGGIPQDMVREPIRRTKQQPDGRLIYGESLPKPKAKPDIGLLVKPKMPLPYPKDETMIPTSLYGLKKEQDFNNTPMGLIPQTPEQRRKYGMTPYDNTRS
jgi:hypothetical protein